MTILKWRYETEINLNFNPRTDGGLRTAGAGGAHMCPPANSKTTQRIDKWKKHSIGLNEL